MTAYYNTKARKITVKASAQDNAKLSYKINSTKLSINKSTGVVSVPKKYMGQVTVTITSAETEKYLKTSKKIALKWKKISVATGYQIQYSTSSKFAKGNKSVKVTKKTTVTKTLKSLKKGKTYYVRSRSYKTISKTKVYSGWSKSKKIKIKK